MTYILGLGQADDADSKDRGRHAVVDEEDHCVGVVQEKRLHHLPMRPRSLRNAPSHRNRDFTHNISSIAFEAESIHGNNQAQHSHSSHATTVTDINQFQKLRR